jgi:hypothetical protein
MNEVYDPQEAITVRGTEQYMHSLSPGVADDRRLAGSPPLSDLLKQILMQQGHSVPSPF